MKNAFVYLLFFHFFSLSFLSFPLFSFLYLPLLSLFFFYFSFLFEECPLHSSENSDINSLKTLWCTNFVLLYSKLFGEMSDEHLWLFFSLDLSVLYMTILYIIYRYIIIYIYIYCVNTTLNKFCPATWIKFSSLCRV